MSRVEQSLGQRVAEHRRLAGLSQAALAEKIGVASEAISRLERGAAVPSVERLDQIATALGVALHDLFRFERTDRNPSRRDRAIDGLVAMVRRANPEDVDTIAKIAAVVLARRR